MAAFPRKTRDAYIDMEHGFVKSIIKNQLDRDRYDKEVKEKMAQSSQVPSDATRRTRTGQRRPDRAIYTPPGMGSVAPSRAVLFKLEYCDSRSGAVRQQPFVEGTDLAEFCATFARKASLNERLQQALCERLRKEMPAEQ